MAEELEYPTLVMSSSERMMFQTLNGGDSSMWHLSAPIPGVRIINTWEIYYNIYIVLAKAENGHYQLYRSIDKQHFELVHDHSTQIYSIFWVDSGHAIFCAEDGWWSTITSGGDWISFSTDTPVRISRTAIVQDLGYARAFLTIKDLTCYETRQTFTQDGISQVSIECDVSGYNTELSIEVNSRNIIIHSATDENGNATTTLLEAMEAIQNDPNAFDLVLVSLNGDGSEILDSYPQTYLDGAYHYGWRIIAYAEDHKIYSFEYINNDECPESKEWTEIYDTGDIWAGKWYPAMASSPVGLLVGAGNKLLRMDWREKSWTIVQEVDGIIKTIVVSDQSNLPTFLIEVERIDGSESMLYWSYDMGDSLVPNLSRVGPVQSVQSVVPTASMDMKTQFVVLGKRAIAGNASYKIIDASRR